MFTLPVVSCGQSFGPLRLWPNAGDPGLAPVSGFARFDHTAVQPLLSKLASWEQVGWECMDQTSARVVEHWLGPRNPTWNKSWSIDCLVTTPAQTFFARPMSTQQSLRAAARADHAVRNNCWKKKHLNFLFKKMESWRPKYASHVRYYTLHRIAWYMNVYILCTFVLIL